MKGVFTAPALMCVFFYFGATVGRAQTASLSDLDSLRYIASHPDLIEVFGADPAKGRSHYEQYGLKEGRKITFDPLRYTASHPDLISAFALDEVRAVTHYIQHGLKEGRQVSFDALRYTASHPDLIESFGDDEKKAASHYIQWGAKEKRAITFSDLDALNYIASHIDLIRAFGADLAAGLRHYVTFGYKEGRRIIFDGLAYIATYSDLIAAFGADALSGVRHFIQWGLGEGREVQFNSSEYLDLNPDLLRTIGTNSQMAARHFIESGVSEARLTSSSFQLSSKSVAFGLTAIGSVSERKTVTLINTGSNTLLFAGVFLDGPDKDQFNQNNNCALAQGIPPKSSCVIQIEFRPTKSGVRQVSLYISRASGRSLIDPKVVITGAGGAGGLGDSPGLAATNAAALLASRPDTESGLYWFDPDGIGGNDPFLTYADMSTAGGGWTQVRRIAAIGGWFPLDDNLNGNKSYNVDFASEINSSTHWSLKFDYFVDSNTEYLFADGDRKVWCVLRRGARNFEASSDGDLERTTILYSGGVARPEGAKVNVLLRATSGIDPLIGCEGNYAANSSRMLYGEAGSQENRFAPASGKGVNVFVRQASVHPRTAETIVNVDAVNNGTADPQGKAFLSGASPVRIFVEPGDYEFIPVRASREWAAFTAISPSAGNKFVHAYNFRSSESELVGRVENLRTFDWIDPEAAFSDAPKSTTLRMNKKGWIEFFFVDANPLDNSGGVSLLVKRKSFSSIPVITGDTSFASSQTGIIKEVLISNQGLASFRAKYSLDGSGRELFKVSEADGSNCESVTQAEPCRLSIRWLGDTNKCWRSAEVNAALRIDTGDSRAPETLTLQRLKDDIIFSDIAVGNSVESTITIIGPLKGTLGDGSGITVRAENIIVPDGHYKITSKYIAPSPFIPESEALSQDFSVVKHNCGSGVPEGASCQITFSYSPKSPGVKVARLNIRDNNIRNSFGWALGHYGSVMRRYSLCGE